MSAKFGPAGNSESFAKMKYKSSLDVPEYIEKMGLDAYEYQCGRGVNINDEKAILLGKLAAEKGVALSIHAPYYISLAAAEQPKLDNSINYILKSARAADKMDASRVILHPGSKGKFDRHDAVNLALDTFKRAIVALDDEGLGHITLCPETMGKINQLGDLDEIMEFCKIDDRVIPCIDFGHLNSRTHGGLKTKDDFGKVLDTIEKTIGNERMKKFHAHFSKIEWSEGGEVKHLTFEDTVFGPDFRFLAEIIAERKCSPTIICESAGTQAEDALTMKKMYLSAVEGCAR